MNKTKFMTTEYSNVRNKIKSAKTDKKLICEEFCYSSASKEAYAIDEMVRLNKLKQIDNMIAQFKAERR